MSALASLPAFEADMSLAAVLVLMEGHEEKPLHIAYGASEAQAGYHITEVKAGSFVTLDCGGNPDAWQETVLQVEDIAPRDDKPMITVGKFRAILAQVDKKVRLAHEARLTIEIGQPGEPMRVFDCAQLALEADRATMVLGMRPAICKPRHRAEEAARASACCAPSAKNSSCC